VQAMLPEGFPFHQFRMSINKQTGTPLLNQAYVTILLKYSVYGKSLKYQGGNSTVLR